VGHRDADQLAKDLAFRGRSAQQVLHSTQAGQQRLEGTAEAGPATDAKQIFGTGIEIDERAVRIDNQDGGGETAENVPRQGRRIGAFSCR
jgi:hypothetical protein